MSRIIEIFEDTVREEKRYANESSHDGVRVKWHVRR
jgi:hypothetical protein